MICICREVVGFNHTYGRSLGPLSLAILKVIIEVRGMANSATHRTSVEIGEISGVAKSLE